MLVLFDNKIKLLDMFKKNNNSEHECTEAEIKAAKEKFMEFYSKNDNTIKDLSQQHGVVLDYSIDSMNELMKLIQSAKGALERGEISLNFAELLISVFGIYVGDTLMKNGLEQKGFKWSVPEEIKDSNIRKVLNYPANKSPFLLGNSILLV